MISTSISSVASCYDLRNVMILIACALSIPLFMDLGPQIHLEVPGGQVGRVPTDFLQKTIGLL